MKNFYLIPIYGKYSADLVVATLGLDKGFLECSSRF